jgi:hypothetical protein
MSPTRAAAPRDAVMPAVGYDDGQRDMSRSYPLPVTSKMKGGMLAAGIGTVFLVFRIMILDSAEYPNTAIAFYVAGASAIVIGVFFRDFRLEQKRRRHVRRKGRQRRGQDWKPQIEVTSRRPDLNTFLDAGIDDGERSEDDSK